MNNTVITLTKPENDIDVSLAKSRLGKDLSDAAFRFIQMYITWALVWYFYTETKSYFALAISLAFAPMMFLYLFNAPRAAILDFEKAQGDRHPLLATFVWLGFVLIAAAAVTAMTFSDIIIGDINRLTHPVAHPSGQTG